jgi:hypothetical protein
LGEKEKARPTDSAAGGPFWAFYFYFRKFGVNYRQYFFVGAGRMGGRALCMPKRKSEIYRKGAKDAKVGMGWVLVPAFPSPTQAELGWGTLGV